jgi:hypothetical protein
MHAAIRWVPAGEGEQLRSINDGFPFHQVPFAADCRMCFRHGDFYELQ